MRKAAWFGLLFSAPLAAQQLVQYSDYQGPYALGYPVPTAVESLTPVAGFRSLASLHARHQSLYLQSPWVSGTLLGRSREDRPIWGYGVSDGDDLTATGQPEPAALLSGAVHAREWQSPEVVTGLLESLVAGASDAGLGQFLVENLDVVLVPVVNPDGLAHTQRYPARVVSSGASFRDGRQRRKNLRDSDGVLETLDDYLSGVDLNRQFPPFWGGGSASPGAINHRGPRVLSEPESQALVAANQLFTPGRLRLYTDFHSFGRVLIVPETDRPALDALNRLLAGRLQAHLQALDSRYDISYWPRSAGIGATDEYHAETYGVPSWTFEIEPGGSGGAEYGGYGVRGDGFMLPATEIARVRAEIASAYRLALYHQYGPPGIQAATLIDVDAGQVVYAAHWRPGADGRRQLWVSQDGALRADRDYRLWLAFDKPMRHRVDGAVADYPGQTVAPLPTIELRHDGGAWTLPGTGMRWLDQPGDAPDGYRHYRDDALVAAFTTPTADWVGDAVGLAVTVSDMAGLALDGDPASPVGFAAGWTGYQAGMDTTLTINASGILLRDGFEP